MRGTVFADLQGEVGTSCPLFKGTEMSESRIDETGNGRIRMPETYYHLYTRKRGRQLASLGNGERGTTHQLDIQPMKTGSGASVNVSPA